MNVAVRIVIAVIVAVLVAILVGWLLGYTEAPAQGFLSTLLGIIAGVGTYYGLKDRNTL